LGQRGGKFTDNGTSSRNCSGGISKNQGKGDAQEWAGSGGREHSVDSRKTMRASPGRGKGREKQAVGEKTHPKGRLKNTNAAHKQEVPGKCFSEGGRFLGPKGAKTVSQNPRLKADKTEPPDLSNTCKISVARKTKVRGVTESEGGYGKFCGGKISRRTKSK